MLPFSLGKKKKEKKGNFFLAVCSILSQKFITQSSSTKIFLSSLFFSSFVCVFSEGRNKEKTSNLSTLFEFVTHFKLSVNRMQVSLMPWTFYVVLLFFVSGKLFFLSLSLLDWTFFSFLQRTNWSTWLTTCIQKGV